MNRLIIDSKLPSLNEYTRACRNNKYAGAEFKKSVESLIGWSIKAAAIKGEVKAVQNYPCEVNIEWHEKTKRRDVDNIQSAQKFILDAMQHFDIIKTDGRKHVAQINHKIIDDKKDFVVVELIERK